MKLQEILDCRNKILLGDNLSILKQIENDTFDLIITSPPYFQQRDYGNGDLGIGNETTEAEYLKNILIVFSECVRVLKKTGAIVLNLGDKYINGSLSLIPYKFAIQATQNQSIFLINQITWSKLNPTPRQDKRKLIQATEPFFIFAKSKDYYFDLDNYLQHLDSFNKSIKSKPSDKLGKKYLELIKNSDLSEEQKINANKALNQAILAVHNREIEGFRMKIHGVHKLAYGGQDGGRNNQIKNNGFTIIRILGNTMKKDIIESPVEITKNNHHPAVYPIYIIQELIKLLTQEGDFVLDPFCGSGTSCIAARNLNRNYLGIEINPEYVNLANNRMEEPLGSRLPVIVIFAIYKQLFETIRRFENKILLPLNVHTSADKHGYGDIEIRDNHNNPFEILDIKHNIPIDRNMILDIVKKSANTTIERYYILTTYKDCFINQDEEEYINELILNIKRERGLEIIANGIVNTLKYYLCFIEDYHEFINTYTNKLVIDARSSTEVKDSHIQAWRIILQQYL